ncbi:MAG TPA: hypothetical protein VLM42_18535 [Bryobacteraceae bacterium]|nr:hypothetical protein [Bryobacteraceae bacterium]
MKSRNVTRIMCLITAGVMTMGSLAAAPRESAPGVAACQADDWNFQEEASRLLKEVQTTATSLSREARVLHSFTRGGLSWDTHINQVNVVKDHVNTMGKHLDRLQAIRHVTMPWQQQAIHSVMPSALILAEHTESAIEHLNDREKPLWDREYVNHLRGIEGRSVQVKQTVDLHLDLATTQDKLERLREQTILLGS